MSRIPEITRDRLDAAGKQTYDEILAARGSIAGPFGIWLHSPEFTKKATQLGEFLRYHTSLPARLSELAILVTARFRQSPVEWAIHEPLARKAGLHDGVIRALRGDTIPAFCAEDEEAVYQFCRQLHQGDTADEKTVQRLVRLLGEKAAVEITGLCGYYTMVAMTLNAFAVPLPSESK